MGKFRKGFAQVKLEGLRTEDRLQQGFFYMGIWCPFDDKVSWGEAEEKLKENVMYRENGLELRDVLERGKYAGEMVERVIQQNPNYFLFVSENFWSYRLGLSSLKRLISQIERDNAEHKEYYEPCSGGTCSGK